MEIKPEIRLGYPVLINDQDLTDTAFNLAEELVGKENRQTLDKRMSSEDFAFYSNKYMRMAIVRQ